MKYLYFILIVGICISSLVFLAPEPTEAVDPLFYDFGGYLITPIFCDEGILLTIFGPKGGQFMFNWGTTLYSAWNITTPGVGLLGKALIVPSTCTVGNIVIVAPFKIFFIGTSLLPAI